MQSFPPTIILRHRRENLRKCSLKGLENRADLRFFSYPKDTLPGLDSYLLLTVDAPYLSAEDANWGLLLLDGTWRYAASMEKNALAHFTGPKRSIPPFFQTAYPRRQTDCQDPKRGLASVEALYLSYRLLGRSTHGLLDEYHWKNDFYHLNQLTENS